MKTKNTVSKKDESSNPRPKEQTNTIESQKDELFDRLAQVYEESVESAGTVINKTITVLLFLKEAFNHEGVMPTLVLHLKHRKVSYCESTDGVGEILEWLSAELHECWDQIDRTHIGLVGKIRRYRGV